MFDRGVAARSVALCAGVIVLLVLWTPAALAQVVPDPNVVPTKNTGGFVYGMAVLVGVLGVVVVIALVVGYLRFAPRFQRDEQGRKIVHADRVAVGEEFPRRSVDVSQAQPVVVAPPALPAETPAAAAATAPAPAAAPAAPPAAAAQVAPAPQAAPAPAAAPAQASPAAERPEVSLDEEVFEAKLAELLDQGVTRRVAEGQARRAAMIAARKKAEGS
ncbi:MAG: hypothetical protein WEA54_06185 [Actinomycetota bacterium]